MLTNNENSLANNYIHLYQILCVCDMLKSHPGWSMPCDGYHMRSRHLTTESKQFEHQWICTLSVYCMSGLDPVMLLSICHLPVQPVGVTGLPISRHFPGCFPVSLPVALLNWLSRCLYQTSASTVCIFDRFFSLFILYLPCFLAKLGVDPLFVNWPHLLFVAPSL